MNDRILIASLAFAFLAFGSLFLLFWKGEAMVSATPAFDSSARVETEVNWQRGNDDPNRAAPSSSVVAYSPDTNQLNGPLLQSAAGTEPEKISSSQDIPQGISSAPKRPQGYAAEASPNRRTVSATRTLTATAADGSRTSDGNDQRRISSFGPDSGNSETVDEINDTAAISEIDSALSEIATAHEEFGLPLKDGGGNFDFSELLAESGEAGIQTLANAFGAVNFDAIAGGDQFEVLDELQDPLNYWISQDPDGSLEWLGDQEESVYRHVVNGFVSVTSPDDVARTFSGLPESSDLVLVKNEIESGESN